MRKFLALLLVLVTASVCFADVTAEIIGNDIDSNGNIIVKTQYKIDGVEVKSPYPLQDGKSYFVTRYNVVNFAGMNTTQIADRIKQDMTEYAQHLITNKYIKEENAKVDFREIIGTSITQKTADIQISNTTAWEVSTNGTKVEKTISAVTAE